MTNLLNFAVITIFARETLEGGIIIGEYRTVALRSDWENREITRQQALNAITFTALWAALLALIVCAAIAIPLHLLSKDFDDRSAIVIEGVSKIVAAISILQLSVKIPKFFGLYYSKAQLKRMKKGEPLENIEELNGMSLRAMRFNVAWNIWREVAECGVFLIPFFLSGDDVMSIPLSAVVGIVVGGVVCVAIYYANKRMDDTRLLTVFTVSLLVLLSTGLFCDGSHKLEVAYGSTPVVWRLEGDFWDVNRLPMTIFKPFGYSDTRTVLQMATFWIWLVGSVSVHYHKYIRCRKPAKDDARAHETTFNSVERRFSKEEARTDDSGETVSYLPERSEDESC